MRPCERIEVVWHRGLPDEWHAGTMLADGRVQVDDWHLYVPEPPFVLEHEEIADMRPA